MGPAGKCILVVLLVNTFSDSFCCIRAGTCLLEVRQDFGKFEG